MNRRVGILGGGQLARMLAESALRMGLAPAAYAEAADCPAAEICVETVVGKLSEREKLADFLRSCQVVVFENEFVDGQCLRAAGEAPFFPRLEAIELLQDKLKQKRLLAEAGVATSPFLELDPVPGFAAEIGRAIGELGPVVLKWSRLGYDGKGVFLDASARPEDAVKFCEGAAARGIAVFAEARIDFHRELAMIGCAGTEFVRYPLVVSEQAGGICRRVYGPATALGIPESLQSLAETFARRIAAAAGLGGSFGIEFFETTDGRLFVNEIAPRVHNSGHYTQNAFAGSQFENHWRAALGVPLADPMAEEGGRFFAMLNLLGPPELKLSALEVPLPVAPARVHLHWYAKKDIRPGRKLGHLNGVATSAAALESLLKELEKCENAWVKSLQDAAP